MLLLLPAWGLLVVFVLAAALPLKGQSAAEAAVDVVHYRAQIEPDIKGKTLKGKVSVRFLVKADTLSAIQFNCGTLVVDGVQEAGKPLAFKQHDGWLVISLSAAKPILGGKWK